LNIDESFKKLRFYEEQFIDHLDVYLYQKNYGKWIYLMKHGEVNNIFSIESSESATCLTTPRYMVSDEDESTNLQFWLRKEKHMPEGFAMNFVVEIKAINKWVLIKDWEEGDSQIMLTKKL